MNKKVCPHCGTSPCLPPTAGAHADPMAVFREEHFNLITTAWGKLTTEQVRLCVEQSNARLAPLVSAIEELRAAGKGGPFVFAFSGEKVLAEWEKLRT